MDKKKLNIPNPLSYDATPGLPRRGHRAGREKDVLQNIPAAAFRRCGPAASVRELIPRLAGSDIPARAGRTGRFLIGISRLNKAAIRFMVWDATDDGERPRLTPLSRSIPGTDPEIA